MKILTAVALIALTPVLIPSLAKAQPAAPAPGTPQARVSPHDLSSAVIDGNRVMIIYGRPYTKAPGTGEVRKIWGGLVPWGQLWRLGANEATLMITQQPITVGNVEVPAGAYSLAMIPQENGPSKLIINKQIGQAGGEHDEKLDVGRADLTRSTIAQTIDQLTIEIAPREGGGGTIAVKWENTQFSVPFTVKK
jgi:hypothetical protein